jgi:DNA-directed RNA polymerase subunit RPC12/RpoP
MKEYVKYICHKCNYKWRMRRGTSAVLRCPYCGGHNVEEDDFDLDKMIREA